MVNSALQSYSFFPESMKILLEKYTTIIINISNFVSKNTN